MDQKFKMNLLPFYKISMWASLIMIIIITLQIMIFIISPPPDTIKGFFELYQQNAFLGLLSLDFLYLINNAILIIIYFALFTVLYQQKSILVIFALIFGLIGIACYYPSNPAFEMLTLSNQFFNSAPNHQQLYLAAGETLMASYTGTAFNVYYIFSTISLLLFSYAMINTNQFKKSIGWWGAISGFFMIIPSSAGMLGMIFSLLSLIPWVVFVFLLMIHFKKLTATTD